MTTAKNKVFIRLLLENCYLGGEINFWSGRGRKGNKKLIRRKPTRGKILPGGQDEQILGWWGDSPCRKNPVVSYVKAKKKKEKLFLQS